ncbi:MAG: translation initiation factor eIF-1A [Candidatus Woesearchaeota archaeon]
MERKPRVFRDKGGRELSQEEVEQLEIRRIRLPRGRETMGVLDQRLGASRMRVRCMDGKTRICRVPGRLKRRLWVREGDILLIEPWELGGDEKGDVVFKYRPSQVNWLKRSGHLKQLEAEEF